MILSNFPKKLHEIENILGRVGVGGGVIPEAPIGSANGSP